MKSSHVSCCLETFIYQQYGAVKSKVKRSDLKLDKASTMLNPLANPKGVKIFCELCPKPAYFQCTECRVAYYWYVESLTLHVYLCKVLGSGLMSEYTIFLICSNYEHLQHDLFAIHGLVCPLLAQARKPIPHANSSEERLEMKQQQQKTRVSSAHLLHCVYLFREAIIYLV